MELRGLSSSPVMSDVSITPSPAGTVL